jgi:CRISPR/Cas system-associated protein endoribonuclease Cas2
MTHQEIIKQIVNFPIYEQFEIIEEIQRNIKKHLPKTNGNSKQLSVEEKLAIVESLAGALKMENPPMNKEEERKIIEDYLSEKYK